MFFFLQNIKYYINILINQEEYGKIFLIMMVTSIVLNVDHIYKNRDGQDQKWT